MLDTDLFDINQKYIVAIDGDLIFFLSLKAPRDDLRQINVTFVNICFYYSSKESSKTFPRRTGGVLLYELLEPLWTVRCK